MFRNLPPSCAEKRPLDCSNPKATPWQTNGNDVMRFTTLLKRSLKLKCNLCGQGSLFKGWFQMHPSCSHCGHVFEREPGFFLGSVYINYGLTALIICAFYPIMLYRETITPRALLISATIFMVVFPIWFFRYARALWCGFDEWVDPVPTDTSKKPVASGSADSGQDQQKQP